MKFFYTRDYHLCARSPDEYVSRGIINIVEHNMRGEMHTIGRVGIEIVDYTRVFKEGMASLYEICDSNSHGWPYLYSLIFDSETGDVLQEVTQLGSFEFIALINRIELLPPAREIEDSILYHLAHINGCATLSCLWSNLTTLSAAKLSEMGFGRIVNSNLLLLNTALPTKSNDFSNACKYAKLDSRHNYSEELEKLWQAGYS